jgi:predicted dienelactone hydrolase
MYDPFLRGRFPVGVRSIEARDAVRDRVFPCEIWYPAAGQDAAPEIREAAVQPGAWPLIVFSHSSGGGRRQSTFLCTHLASHGYVVASMDHSEKLVPGLARPNQETGEQKAARQAAWIAGRVPDVRFLLDHLLDGAWDSEARLDPARIGIVGHSFGGWTALAAPDAEPRIRAVVALAPGGASNPKPGILQLQLGFDWGRDVPTLYLVAADDISLPLAGMYEIFARTPAAKQMVILRRADHLHFMDDFERLHEVVRNMSFPGDAAWISKEMRPIAELCKEPEAHLFVRGLTLCHLDATLRQQEEARRFMAGDVEAELAARGVDAAAVA